MKYLTILIIDHSCKLEYNVYSINQYKKRNDLVLFIRSELLFYNLITFVAVYHKKEFFYVCNNLSF